MQELLCILDGKEICVNVLKINFQPPSHQIQNVLIEISFFFLQVVLKSDEEACGSMNNKDSLKSRKYSFLNRKESTKCVDTANIKNSVCQGFFLHLKVCGLLKIPEVRVSISRRFHLI